MKIKRMMSIAMLLVLFLSGCASSQQSQIKYIGAAKAKSLALEAGGVSASQAEFSTVDLSERGGQDYYQVAFTAFGEDYYYDIDALTGVIIDAKVPAGSIKNEMNAAGDADGGETDSGTGQNTADPDTAGTGQTSDGMITEKQARIKALAHAGLSEEEVIFLKTELDIEDGRKVYEVEFLSNDTKEYDYEIDASSGDVVSYDFEAESAIPPAADRDSMISEQKAKELALAQVP